MSLISRIDALPIRAEVLCGSFVYGYTENSPKNLEILWRSVSVQMCTAIRRPFGIWRCGVHGAIGKKSELGDGRSITEVHLPNMWPNMWSGEVAWFTPRAS